MSRSTRSGLATMTPPAQQHRVDPNFISPSTRPKMTHKNTTLRQTHYCYGCQRPCTEEGDTMIQALGRIYHYACFVCEVCNTSVVAKFYAIRGDQHGNEPRAIRDGSWQSAQTKRIVCEHHAMTSHRVACKQCGKPIISDSNNMVDGCHIHCLPCSECLIEHTTSPQPASFLYGNRVYCRLHYSILQSNTCMGCDQIILEAPVKDLACPDRQWHSECYQIDKFWNVRLADLSQCCTVDKKQLGPVALYAIQTTVDRKRTLIWQTMQTFENSTAMAISDLSLHIASGAFQKGVHMAHQVAFHLTLLFRALHDLDLHLRQHEQETALQCDPWARDACHALGSFIQMLIQSPKHGTDIMSDIRNLVSNLAKNLKQLIRIGLVETLRRECPNGIHGPRDALESYLSEFTSQEKTSLTSGRYRFQDSESLFVQSQGTIPDLPDDKCQVCQQAIQHTCYRYNNLYMHTHCLVCSVCTSELDTQQAHAYRASESSKEIIVCNMCSTREKLCVNNISPLAIDCVTSIQYCLLWLQASHIQLRHCQFYATKKASESFGLKKHETMHQHLGTKINNDLTGYSHPTSFPHNKPTKVDLTCQPPVTASMPKPNRQLSTTTTTTTTPTVARENQPLSQHITNQSETRTSADLPHPPHNGTRSHATARVTHDTTLQNQPNHNVATVDKMAPSNRAIGMDSRYQPSRTTQNSAHPGVDSNAVAAATFTMPTTHEQRPKHRATADQGMGLSPPFSQPVHWLAELPVAQDIIMRYMTVYYVTDAVGDLFTLEELQAMVECKKASLWGKLKTHIRGNGYKPMGDTATHCKTFGVPLLTMAMREKASQPTDAPASRTALLRYIQHQHPIMAVCFSSNTSVPVLVQNCILALLQSDVSVEGIFRKNGNIRELNHMCEAIDKFETLKQQYGLLDVLCTKSPIQVAALLKRFLRELPEPLLTYKLYKLFLSALRMNNERTTKTVLHFACCMLPKPNRDVMQLLFLFLAWVASFHSKNKMHISNLASVIAPSVLCSPSSKESVVDLALPQSGLPRVRGTVASDEIKVISMLIQYQHEFCTVPGEIIPLLHNSRLSQELNPLDPALSTKELTRTLGHLIKLNKHNASVATVASHQPPCSTTAHLPPVPRSLSTPAPTQPSIPTSMTESVRTRHGTDTQRIKQQYRKSWIPGRFPS